MDEFYNVMPYENTWVCSTCNKTVPSESSQAHDARGNLITVWTPASRYWLPGSKPYLTRGVFCSVECSQIHQRIVDQLFKEPA